MELTKWRVKDKIYYFPSDWNKDKVLNFVNAKHIKVCQRCGKVDIPLNHFSNCNPVEEQQRQLNDEYYD